MGMQGGMTRIVDSKVDVVLMVVPRVGKINKMVLGVLKMHGKASRAVMEEHKVVDGTAEALMVVVMAAADHRADMEVMKTGVGLVHMVVDMEGIKIAAVGHVGHKANGRVVTRDMVVHKVDGK